MQLMAHGALKQLQFQAQLQQSTIINIVKRLLTVTMFLFIAQTFYCLSMNKLKSLFLHARRHGKPSEYKTFSWINKNQLKYSFLLFCKNKIDENKKCHTNGFFL